MSDCILKDEEVLKTTKKHSVALVNGFRCENCGLNTVTYDDTAPLICSDCGAPSPKHSWRNLVVDNVTVYTLKIKTELVPQV